MKQEMKIVRDLKEFLKEVIKPILQSPRSLRSSKKFKNIGLTAREVLGLFLVCAVGNYIDKDEWTLASDPDGYDGIIMCRSKKRESEGLATEQVYIPPFEAGDLTDLVLDRIKKKSSRGKEYGKNRHLIIFCDKFGSLDHQRIKKTIASNNIFYSYWVIGRFSPDKWHYLVTSPKTVSDPTMAYEVKISDNFENWEVRPLGRI